MSLIDTNINDLSYEQEKKHARLKKERENMDVIKFSINLPRHIHTEFKRAVASERTDMKTVLMAHILKYIDKYK